MQVSPCLDDPVVFGRMSCDVLQASHSSSFCPRTGACQRRWLGSSFPQTILDAGPNVCNSLPLGSHSRSEGLGFNQFRLRHTHLALATRRIGSFLLRGFPCMLWSPSSFEGRGKQGVHGTLHQFQQLALHSISAASTTHTKKCYDPGNANRYILEPVFP